MSYLKCYSYCDLPFSSETPERDFYIYSDIKDLTVISETCKENVLKCRTVAVLQSVHGKFFLTDLDTPTMTLDELHIRVSMVHMKNPPQSTVVPYPVQIFGTLQWKNRPVIFATIIQMLSAANALRLRNALCGVTSVHLANNTRSNETDLRNDNSDVKT
ncbi:uncharacterized protein LOC113232846 [Hyposmocoma kahamanoa]|uniref:uncharacterized protein LOC113232846 n=1 Tax=Hyposmocoma kahamanoa TaxID=1477025 RepID=UPI000E6D9287|nr:uncharacterized protein LOC113232846 [Hyposmocoma kahamanoa]